MSTRRAQTGFTLLEVVVAFVLLAVILVTVFQIFSSGLARASDLDERSRALVLAQSRIAVVGLEQKIEGPSQSRGESDDRKYRWTLTVEPYDEPTEQGQPQPMSSLQLYRVESTVAWEGVDGRARDLRLTTLTLGAKL
jgi:general secretion pathway protein I